MEFQKGKHNKFFITPSILTYKSKNAGDRFILTFTWLNLYFSVKIKEYKND